MRRGVIQRDKWHEGQLGDWTIDGDNKRCKKISRGVLGTSGVYGGVEIEERIMPCTEASPCEPGPMRKHGTAVITPTPGLLRFSWAFLSASPAGRPSGFEWLRNRRMVTGFRQRYDSHPPRLPPPTPRPVEAAAATTTTTITVTKTNNNDNNNGRRPVSSTNTILLPSTNTTTYANTQQQ